ncbi:MAG TPA: TIGR03067 domain-containing protein [Pirellulales bacterium]|nr:TIGR03067 domain-containing protein [Pirellulales bacterium]
MRRFKIVLFVSLFAGWSVSYASSAGDDTQAWQGTWKLVSCMANGTAQMADMQWIVSGSQYTVRLNGQSAAVPYVFKLDLEQKHIDVFHHDTPAGTFGGRFKGIYDAQGNSLRVCYDLKGQKYPKSFDASRGSAQVLYEFQRSGN